ncbi:MAG: S8 family serine peptidase [Solirubrobacterales bacterium]
MGSVLTAGEEVLLQSRQFVPSQNSGEIARTSSQVHVLIQLEGIPTAEWRATFLLAGVNLLSYIPDHTWLASLPADKITTISQIDGVETICEILAKDKLAPSIREAGINARSLAVDGQARLAVILFEDVSPANSQAIVESLGGVVLAIDPASNSLEIRLPVAAIQDLAASDGVKWIDQYETSIDLNDGVRNAIHAGVVQAAPYDVNGSGVVIGQWESKHPDGTHVDLAGRVTNVGKDLAIGDHATQMAGTIIGDGSLLPDRRYRGMAPKATLVSFPTWDTVAELRQQYREAIDTYKIDIANNSWGKVEWHVYRDYAAAMDDIVRGSLGKRISIVWAVGNEGGWNTILCTAAAKNIVAVGATNSDDNSLWTWSNKGPTKDGRIKPDIVSSGCETHGGSIWSTLPCNRYGGSCGTSSAVPSVTGVMALILSDWRATHDIDPIPSTIKGILIHTAMDLGETGPDYAYGYGLIDAKNAIDLVRKDSIEDVIREEAISTQDEQDTYAVDLDANEPQLKVTLVWDDYPANPMALHTLVNDLDLVVVGPDGKRYYPWTLDPHKPRTPAVRTQADHTNNVEQVCVENPAKGTWQITVWGTTVPHDNQTYSLLTSRGGPTSVQAGSARTLRFPKSAYTEVPQRRRTSFPALH